MTLGHPGCPDSSLAFRIITAGQRSQLEQPSRVGKLCKKNHGGYLWVVVGGQRGGEGGDEDEHPHPPNQPLPDDVPVVAVDSNLRDPGATLWSQL